MPEIKGYNEELRQQLETYRSAGRDKPLTMTELGQEIGVSSTRINKYLLGKPEGDVAELEARIEDVIKTAARRKVSDVVPFETNVTSRMWSTFESIRNTNDVGLISGPAGIGKSMAIRVFCQRNPTTISITLSQWDRSEICLQGSLFDAVSNRSWDHFTKRGHWLAQRLINSNRLIIIDNAQRMAENARRWLFDFHDASGCPIAMVGNPEVLVALRRNDQQFSRIGIYQDLKLAPNKIAEYARRLVEAIVPDPQPGLYDLATIVAEQRGHLRALRKQLLLMLDLSRTASMAGDQVKAFHAAHTKLVRDYQL